MSEYNVTSEPVTSELDRDNNVHHALTIIVSKRIVFNRLRKNAVVLSR